MAEAKDAELTALLEAAVLFAAAEVKRWRAEHPDQALALDGAHHGKKLDVAILVDLSTEPHPKVDFSMSIAGKPVLHTSCEGAPCCD